jgi:membrane protease YdiL (CAAX protease family)
LGAFLGSRKKQVTRIGLALSLFLGIIYAVNSHPGLIPLPGYLPEVVVEAAILLLSILAAWNAGILRGVQSKSKVALLEVLVLAITLVALLVVNGTECNPLAFCITVGGSFQGEPFRVYLTLVGVNIIVAVSEEFFSRAYLLRDIYLSFKNVRGGILAVSVSALVFALSHVPVLSVDSFNSSPIMYLLASIFIVGLSYGLVYWWTGWNLMLVVLMHFFYDTFGGMVTVDQFDPLSPIRYYSVVVLIPSAVILIFHYACARVRWRPKPLA